MKMIKGKGLSVAGLLLGGIGGFLYWKYVGCSSGTCAIKSVWYWSTLWGAALGYLLGDLVNEVILKIKEKRTKDDREV